jgi:hypothetical protein
VPPAAWTRQGLMIGTDRGGTAVGGVFGTTASVDLAVPTAAMLLDCESNATITACMVTALGISEQELVARVSARLPAEAGEGATFDASIAGKVLRDRLLTSRDVSELFSGTCWFHFTRVPRGTMYCQGLLPTHLTLESIWSVVEPVALRHISPSTWGAFRSDMPECRCHWANLYRIKIQERHAGPFGFLVRQSAFSPEGKLWSHFHEGAETQVDICRCFEHTFGTPIEAEVAAETVPVIVKFWTPGCDADDVAASLAYLRDCLAVRPLGVDYDIACFEGNGQAVPPTQVLGVEWLDE